MSAPRDVGLGSLSEFPLPSLSGANDKEGRGRVLAIGGGAQVPGALILTGLAALRAGAGKLQMATGASGTLALGIAVIFHGWFLSQSGTSFPQPLRGMMPW